MFFKRRGGSVVQIFLEEFIDGGLEVGCQGRDVMVLLQAAQLVDVHLDLIFFARLLEPFLVDLIALDGTGLEQDDVVLVGALKVA